MLILKTQRLLLRTWSEKDLDSACQLWGDPRVMELIDVRGGLDRGQVREKLLTEIQRQEEHGIQYWAVETQEPREIVGCCGLRPYSKEGVLELGFQFRSDRWGKGYASEAARAVIDHAFKQLRVKKLFAGHNPKNEASAHMMKKLGFKFVREEFYEPTGLMHPSYELEC